MACCFTSQKNDKNRGGSSASKTCDKDRAKNDDILAEIFSVKEHERRLEKAKWEEKRLEKEAKKLLKTVKMKSSKFANS